MRAVDIRHGTGAADALFINDDVPTPEPGESEALVKIKAFGLNRMDLLQREGRYPVPAQASKILGVEFSGTIERLGSRPEREFKVGDEVFGLAYGGAYAEYVAVSTHMLIHKPAELSWEQAAGIPETWITALQALHQVGGFQAGQSVLWHAGASSVSLAGIQLSRAASASAIYVTASSAEKIRFCVDEVGATVGFNYKTEDWSAAVRHATHHHGVDLIIDFVGAPYFAPNLAAAARDGHIVALGALGGTTLGPAEVDIGAFIAKRVRYEGTTLRSRDLAYQTALRDLLVEKALPKLRDGSFRVFVDKVFPWQEVAQAHRFMEGNTSKGKIICTIG
ncbi:MAG: hypothetical protein M1826_006061 [Phylliscum demangeonii]|nr:MAG: hypothetical protein M1826_006061 [Phylliscum demangeonii]